MIIDNYSIALKKWTIKNNKKLDEFSQVDFHKTKEFRQLKNHNLCNFCHGKVIVTKKIESEFKSEPKSKSKSKPKSKPKSKFILDKQSKKILKQLEEKFRQNEKKKRLHEKEKEIVPIMTITEDMFFSEGYRLPENKRELKIKHRRPKKFANIKVPANKTINKMLKYAIHKMADGCIIPISENECKHGYNSIIKIKTGQIDIRPMTILEERKSRNNISFIKYENKNIARIKNEHKIVELFDNNSNWGLDKCDFSDLTIQ